MLLAKGKIISAMAGLAMLAIPVSAFAGHRQDHVRAGRPFAPFNQGFHNGWANHPQPLPPAPGFGRPVYHQPPTEFIPAPRPIGWNNRWHEEEEEEHEHEWHRRPQNWQNWQRPAPVPSYRCDEDGDDCRGYIPRYQPSYDDDDQSNYGGQPYSWYMAPAPSSLSPNQQLSWLISRRQAAMVQIAQLRSRGDSRGADRVVKRVVNPLTARINQVQRQLGYGYNPASYGYAPSSYAAPMNPILGSLTGNPAYYGAAANNPTLNAIAAVAPLLGVH